MSFLRDLRVAFHSLMRTQGLAITVILTLALGIGANAAIFTLVRGVLLKPLVNRDEDRLIYIRQSAPGTGDENTDFSVPEIQDLRASVKTVSAFGEFSTLEFTMIGLGEPRQVQAGVVSGDYFEVMGLHPVLGRLIGPQDDGPKAAGVVVLTYRFWTTSLRKDPGVLGKNASPQLGPPGRSVCHHHRRARTLRPLSARYGNHRQHRHQPAPPVCNHGHEPPPSHDGTLWPSRSRWHPRSSPRRVALRLRGHDQSAPGSIPAERGLPNQRQAASRTDHLGRPDRAAGAAGSVSAGLHHRVLQCGQLVLTRTVRREGELATRAALGASTGALRRMLLAESLLLCGAGAAVGVWSAQPLVAILARYASRFSVRALDLTVDSSLLWAGAALAVVAAVILAFVPRLPSADTSNGHGLSIGSARITGSTSRRQRIFAVTQIAASFVLLAGASAVVTTLIALQTAQTGLDMRHVLTINVPAMAYGKTPQQVVDFYKESIRRIDALPGVNKTAFGLSVPWRDVGSSFGLQFSADGHVHIPGSCTIGFRLPEYFAGLIPVCGTNPPPNQAYLRHRMQDRQSVAFVTGVTDFNRKENEDYMHPLCQDMGVRTKLWIPKVGHQLPPPDVVVEVMAWLKEDLKRRTQYRLDYPGLSVTSENGPTPKEQAAGLLQAAQADLKKPGRQVARHVLAGSD